ncbi:MAG: chemotaxis protein CheX [Polyangiaceae bacterium]|jgi:CheY-specific phosphatase CheX
MSHDKRLDQLTVLMSDAFEELVEHYGSKLTRISELRGELDLAAIIGFTGERMSGTVALVTSTEGASALRRIAPVTASDTDWLMELSNQMLGSLKRKLAARAASIDIGIPTVIQGKRLAVRLMVPGLIVCTQIWDLAGTSVSLQLGVLMSDDLDLSFESQDEIAVVEGAAIVF